MWNKIKEWYQRNDNTIGACVLGASVGLFACLAYTVGHLDGAAGQLSADREWVINRILDGTFTVKSE